MLFLHVFRGEEGEVTSKKDFIKTARSIAKESEEVVKIARQVADACTDRRMATVSYQQSYIHVHVHVIQSSIAFTFLNGFSYEIPSELGRAGLDRDRD